MQVGVELSGAEWAVLGIVVTVVVGLPALYFAIRPRKPKPTNEVRVTLAVGYIAVMTMGSPKLLIEAMNHGDTVTLTGAGILLPNGNQLFIVKQQYEGIMLPARYGELLGGKNFTSWMDADELARALTDAEYTGTVEVRGFFKDALGRRYLSGPLSFEIDRYYVEASEDE